MAQRTLRRLKDARMVLTTNGPDGSTVYALAEAGSRSLHALGIEAASGKDAVRGISPAYFRHRCISNEVAIAGIVQGLRVSTEREIARGCWLGGETGIAGKKPDVLWRSREAWTWIEVQRSRHSVRDYSQLLSWFDSVAAAIARPGTQIAWKMTLRRIIFICSTAFEAKLRRDLSARGTLDLISSGLLVFERSLYKLEAISFI
jgi:hypothetical protein